jgi:hypothetical protein
MLISKNTFSKFNREQLITYLDELYQKVSEERQMALDAYKRLTAVHPEAVNESFGDNDMLVLMGKTASDYMKLAGEASARLLKIADIKAKIIISSDNMEKAKKQEILNEDEKAELLKIVDGGKK